LVVAITGASAGIGRATALRLARDRAAVSICARREDRLRQVADDVRQLGGRALPVVADVSREADMNDFVTATIREFGGLDVMVCNAGYGLYGAIDQIEPADMQRILEVNLVGTYNAMRACLPHFRRQRRGHIVVISSIAGRRGIPYMGAYAATKFAQAGLVECVRAETRASGLHVTGVYPVSTETDFFDTMTAVSGFTTEAHGPRQSADTVAEAIVRAIHRPVPEVFPYRKARALVWLNAVAPGWCDRLVTKWGRKPVLP
jgi:NADP-dependent 3-hydroxy acid dehydrogenase YdfG